MIRRGSMEYLVVLCLCLMIGPAFSTADGKEIEARRRSALDKNFMRFGRAFPNAHMMYQAADNNQGLDRGLTKRNSNKETRAPAKSGNLMRFGRAGNFMRFGRNDGLMSSNEEGTVDQDMLMERPQIRSTNSFLRFGRTPPQSSVFVPAGAIWPLMHQQFGQEEYLDEEPEVVDK